MKCAYPFIGITNTEGEARVVLALHVIGSTKEPFYSSRGQYNPITVWRAMQLFEMTKTSGEHALAACWSLFHPDARTVFEDACITELAHQFHGEEGLRRMYDEIMESSPSLDNLDMLLSRIFEIGIYIDIGAVCREMSRKGLNLNRPIIHKILDSNPPKPPPDARLGVGKMLAYFLGIRF